MKRALVTGSTGFVGANLAAALVEHGIEVVGLRRTTSPEDAVKGLDISFVTGNILYPETLPLAMKDIDWVFHTAAIADYWQVPAETVHRVNVEGTRNVLRAAQQTGVKRVILTSSSAALGISNEDKPLLDEDDQFNLSPHIFPYGYSKHMADQLMIEFARQGVDVLSVLPSAVIGPRDLKFNAGEMIVQALKPTLPKLPLPTGGLNYIDVRDCVDAHIAAAKKGKPGERYLLAGHNMTHREAMDTVNQTLGTSVKIVEVPGWALLPLAGLVWSVRQLGINLPIDCGRVLLSRKFIYYDNDKAVRELGLKTRPFAESVRDTYEWYVQNNYLQKRGIRTTGPSQAEIC
ncbi:MAG: NAD-dependent epimerase/dehydratase family protein [Anaerolineae bacterium]|nr:NAD-dependent epimerase/dehydratase family protein [Anaerolineae bacterium]